MAIALIVLAVGSVLAGYVAIGGRFEHFLEPSFGPEAAPAAAEQGLEMTLTVVSTAIAIVGIGLAAYFFLRNRGAADAIAERFSGLYRVLLNKYYVDEIYDATVVQPIRIVSQEGLWKGVDVKLIDGAVNGVGDSVTGMSEVLRRVQNGSVRMYAASLLVGVVAILGYYLWR
jgi:NADH-quinone oxidoreductase subunit L